MDSKLEAEDQEQHFHVLAVDDSLIDRKLLERLLTFSSYQVTCVDSGNKALEYLSLLDGKDKSIIDSTASSNIASTNCSSTSSSSNLYQQEGSKVNLIITDYSMPGMSGYDLLRRVKGSSWKDIPVVVVSSENVPATINMCLEGGAEEFLLKPVQLSDLRKLQSHLMKPLLLTPSCQNLDTKQLPDSENDNNNHNDGNSNNNNNNNNNNNSKRKSMSPECSERKAQNERISCDIIIN